MQNRDNFAHPTVERALRETPQARILRPEAQNGVSTAEYGSPSVWLFSGLTILMGILGVAILSASQIKYPYAYAGLIIVLGTQICLPSCRLRSPLLCPWNLAIFGAVIHIVVIPMTILIWGPSLGPLPTLPPVHAINTAMLFSAVAFLSCALSFAFFQSHQVAARPKSAISEKVLPSLSFVYLALGCIGLYLYFQSVGAFVSYFTDPMAFTTLTDTSTASTASLADAAATFLRPFGVLGTAIVFCLRVEDIRLKRSSVLSLLLPAGGLFIFSMSFNYNRGSGFSSFLSALAVVISAGIMKTRTAILLTFIAILLLPALSFFRSSSFTLSDFFSSASVRKDIADQDFLTILQTYGGGPQFAGTFYESSGWGESLSLGKSIVSSVLFPVPLIGKPFRETAGPRIYNLAIYAGTYSEDQIFPVEAESYYNFGVPGIFVVFGILGYALHKLQRYFETCTSLTAVYCIQYLGYWTAFCLIGSFSILSQILIYFVPPMMLMLLFYQLFKSPAGRTLSAT